MKKLIINGKLKCFLSVFSFIAFTIGGASLSAQEKPIQVEKEEKKWYDSITLSGMMRIRPEVRSNIGFKEGAANTSEFVGQKTWITLSANVLENLKTVFTIQDSRIWGGENSSLNGLSTSANRLSTPNEDSIGLDFREAYFDLGLFQDSKMHLIAGRQKIVFGDQRLFGGLEWSNVGRSFDALKIKWDAGANSLNLWSSLLTESNSYDVPQISAYQGQPERYFNGLYNSTKISDFLLLDIYYANKLIVSDSTSLKQHTVGARITDRTADGKTANGFPIDFTAEAAYQFGTMSLLNISAYAGALALGYTLDTGIKIRFGVEGDIASGDTSPLDEKKGTFDNLFPTNHIFYGQADIISWQNLMAFSGNVNFMFSKEFSLALAYWYFSKLTNKDKWYAATGGINANETWITGKNGVSDSTFLAHEVDVTLKSDINKYFGLEGGYSLILPGKAPLDAGNNQLYHFAYILAMAKF